MLTWKQIVEERNGVPMSLFETSAAAKVAQLERRSSIGSQVSNSSVVNESPHRAVRRRRVDVSQLSIKIEKVFFSIQFVNNYRNHRLHTVHTLARVWLTRHWLRDKPIDVPIVLLLLKLMLLTCKKIIVFEYCLNLLQIAILFRMTYDAPPPLLPATDTLIDDLYLHLV